MNYIFRYFLPLALIAMHFSALAQWQQTGPNNLRIECIEKVNNTIWIGNRGGVFISTDDGQSWVQNQDINGLVSDILFTNYVLMVAYIDSNSTPCISTSYDDGTTWTKQPIGIVAGCPYMKMAAVGSAVLLSDYNVYNYISYNYGASWSTIPRPYSNYASKIATDEKNIVAVYLDHQNAKSVVFVSDNMGLNWRLIDSLSTVHGVYIEDSLLILSRGYHVNGYITTLLCKSTNMGLTWDTTYAITDSSIVYDIYKRGQKLYASGSKSIFSSTNGGTSWQYDTLPKNNFYDKVVLANGDELAPSYPQGIARYNYIHDSLYEVAPIRDQYIFMLSQHNGVLYASTEENVFKSTDGNSWQLAGVPQTGITDFEFSGDTIVGITDNYLISSTDNGNTWQYKNAPNRYGTIFKTIEFDGQKIFFGQDSIYFTQDLGASWHTLPQLIDSSYTLPTEPANLKLYAGKLFAVNFKGAIYRYDDITNQWLHLFTTPPSQHNELYNMGGALVMAGYNQLWVSLNTGVDWFCPAMQGLPPNTTPHNLYAVDGLWLGTCERFGVFASNDNGNTWKPFYAGPTPFPCSLRGGLTLLNNTLYAGSNYQSVWKYNGPLSIPSAISETNAINNIKVYPNPASDLLFIDLPGTEQQPLTIMIYNNAGNLIRNERVTGTRAVIKTATLPNGIYTGKVLNENGENKGSFKFISTK